MRAAYYLAPHWRRRRREALKAAGYRCQEPGCYEREGLHVHHLTYARIGSEAAADLLVLCAIHHDMRHPEKTGVRRRRFRGSRALKRQAWERERAARSKAHDDAVSAERGRGALIVENDRLHRLQQRTPK